MIVTYKNRAKTNKLFCSECGKSVAKGEIIVYTYNKETKK